MAIVDFTRETPRPLPGVESVTWVLANTDAGQPIAFSNYSDKTVQVFGTFGSGGSVTLQGSNDPRVLVDYAAGTPKGSETAKWFTLKDPQANAITKTSDGADSGEAILENPLFIRPNCTAGDGTTAITVILVGRKG